MLRSARSCRIYFDTSLKNPLGKQSGIAPRECYQWIKCKEIQGQGLGAHDQTPWTLKQGRNSIGPIKNIKTLEGTYNEN